MSTFIVCRLTYIRIIPSLGSGSCPDASNPHQPPGTRPRRHRATPQKQARPTRNLRIVVLGPVLLLRRQWMPLALLLTITAALPVFDMSVLSLGGVTPPGFHPVALALLSITAMLLWQRAARKP